MKSGIYTGRVRHRRFVPRPHEFEYSLYLMYLDLDEMPTLFDPYWLWSTDRPNFARFRRSDHLGDPDRPLIDEVRQYILEHTGIVADGPIRLLTHCRYLGFGFNPVSFYYCYSADDSELISIVAEVNNTPWGEQFCYVLTDADEDTHSSEHKRYTPSKQFHVSPFIPMNIDYDWRFKRPDKRLTVHMQNFIDGEKLFDATLDLERQEISSVNLARILIRYPLVTAKVSFGIYYEALRLLIKRIPIHDHPEPNEKPAETSKQ